MAKTARRSVASNPSSLTSSSSSNSNYSTSTTNNTSSTGSLPATADPLRITGHQFTTRTLTHNVGRNGTTTTARSFSSNGSNNNRKNFDNVNINGTNSKEFNRTIEADKLAAQREKIRMEFYAAYDVMTGVRIAATLGGFFGLMVFLIVYKSRSHSNETLKVLKDPKIAAVAAACMQEEEDREIQEAIEATGLSIYPDEYDNMLFRRQRMLSLGNVSAPPILHRGFRFSSVGGYQNYGGGGYSSLLEPPRRYSYSGTRRKSVSESSRILSAYPMGSSFGTDDYFIETDDELETEFDRLSTRGDSVRKHELLVVPPSGQESRRSSGMTCCSTESSYLERRCSAITLGLTALPSSLQTKLALTASRRSSTDLWDYYPDIQVIQPTPKTSPCPSERSLNDKNKNQAIGSSSSSSHQAQNQNINNDSNKYNLEKYQQQSQPQQQQNKNIIKKDDLHYDPESITQYPLDKRDYTINADNYDSYHHHHHLHRQCSEYDDNNELKLIVKRKISDPANNNHIYNSNNNSYNHSSHNQNNGEIRRAPLASISSFKISSIDYQDSDLKSLGSDSLFVESFADTDDDMEQFSTDSDEISVSLGAEYVEQPLSVHTMQQQHYHGQQNRHKNEGNQLLSTKSDTSPRRNDLFRNISNKRTRSALGHQRSTSIASNDRTMLISQQSQEKPENSQHQEHEQLFTLENLKILNDGNKNRPSNYTGFVSLPADSNTQSLRTDGTTTGTSSTLNTEIHKPTTSFSYGNNNDSCSSINSRYNKENETKLNNSNNECVEVNVIIENRPTIISPSVILELPVIALPSQVDDPPRDPSLPGTSRKWSKETLF